MEMILELFKVYWNASGDFIALFILSGFAFGILGELIKKSVFPRKENENGEVIGKKCPRWVGLIMGLAWTALFMFIACLASLRGVDRCHVLGGVYFLPIHVVIYFVWQWMAMIIIKHALCGIIPEFMTGRHRHAKEREVYEVPRGAKVKRVD